MWGGGGRSVQWWCGRVVGLLGKCKGVREWPVLQQALGGRPPLLHFRRDILDRPRSPPLPRHTLPLGCRLRCLHRRFGAGRSATALRRRRPRAPSIQTSSAASSVRRSWRLLT